MAGFSGRLVCRSSASEGGSGIPATAAIQPKPWRTGCLPFAGQGDLLRQRNIGGAELAVGLHGNLLLAAGRLQGDAGTETGRFGDQLEAAVGATALNIAADITAGFAPVTGNLAALGDHR